MVNSTVALFPSCDGDSGLFSFFSCSADFGCSVVSKCCEIPVWDGARRHFSTVDGGQRATERNDAFRTAEQVRTRTGMGGASARHFVWDRPSSVCYVQEIERGMRSLKTTVQTYVASVKIGWIQKLCSTYKNEKRKRIPSSKIRQTPLEHFGRCRNMSSFTLDGFLTNRFFLRLFSILLSSYIHVWKTNRGVSLNVKRRFSESRSTNASILSAAWRTPGPTFICTPMSSAGSSTCSPMRVSRDGPMPTSTCRSCCRPSTTPSPDWGG